MALEQLFGKGWQGWLPGLAGLRVGLRLFGSDMDDARRRDLRFAEWAGIAAPRVSQIQVEIEGLNKGSLPNFAKTSTIIP